MSTSRSLGLCLVLGLLSACGSSTPASRGGGGGDENSTGSAGNFGTDNGGSVAPGTGGSSPESGGSMTSGTTDASVHDATPGTDSGGGSHGPCGAVGIF